MIKKVHLISFFIFFSFFYSFAQTGIIKGKVYNSINNEPIPFVSVGIISINNSSITDLNGNYELNKLQPGLYNLSISFVGYRKKNVFEIHFECVWLAVSLAQSL